VYPFIAAGVLVNSLYNLQASALFVVGRAWVVTRCCALHVLLLGGGTFVLLRFGILGYGWAELMACGAYVVIHSGLAKVIRISYRHVAPWLVTFGVGLFVPLAHGAWLIAPGLLGCLALWMWKQASRRTNPAPPIAAELSIVQ
jgi:hypothetical protein